MESFGHPPGGDRTGPAGLGQKELALGDSYAKGNGVPKDPVTAYRWYRASASLNCAEAMWRLVMCHSQGDGCDASDEKAIHFCRLAAAAEHPAAASFLGDCHLRGRLGVAKNLQTATAWFEKAANLGDSTAQNNLGICYTSGASTDWAKATMWWKRSADLGNPNAQYNLGLVYAHGQGVAPDLAAAYGLFH
eukprot:CAMPEP_0182870434 /NCGR_PEP_ID=MMETSP0034_2-20130328/10521_1 /TAXON_ID=156128 /ORGANISM="Nephroselmis pyriformis, Strain CCMP717" /LENGTH=190 /DNA_ID=CAMNT_0025002929 /DNA_START=225 /DNA_END=794 /DNA_ORIENTATION=+